MKRIARKGRNPLTARLRRKAKKARLGRNPRTGEPLKIPAKSRRGPEEAFQILGKLYANLYR